MSGNEKILVLEDNAELRGQIASSLREEGYDAVEASRSEAPAQAAELGGLDMIVLDMLQPLADSFGVADMLQDCLCSTSVLFLIGDSASQLPFYAAWRPDALNCLRKPFGLGLLAGKAEAMLRRLRKKRLIREAEARHSALAAWTAEVLLGQLQPERLAEDGRRRIKEAASLAQRLGGLIGLRAPDCAELGAFAALLSAGADLPSEGPSLELLPECPIFIRTLAEQPHSLPALLARMAAAHVWQREPPQELREQYGYLLAHGLADCLCGGEAVCGRGCETDENLLNLGRALLAAGDGDNAVQAFQQAAAEAAPRQRSAAYLHLAEAARLSENYSEIAAYAEQAAQLAPALGPYQSAIIHLRCALCLMLAGLSGASDYSETACRLLRLLGREPELSRAKLAMAAQGHLPDEELQPALRRWLNSASMPAIQQDAAWLVPHLLRRCGGSEASPYICLLLRLARLFPQPFADCAGDSDAPAELRQAAAGMLQKSALWLGPEMKEQLQKDLAPNCGTLLAGASLEAWYCRSSSRPLWRVSSFGELSVAVGGRAVAEGDWPTSKAKYLFVYLLCHPHGVSDEAILEEFWPRNWEKARQNLYTATSALRRLFRKYCPEGADCIVRSNGRLRWREDLPLWFDLSEVRRLADRVHSSASQPVWQRIVGLVRGVFLADCAMNWTAPIRAEMDSLLHRGLLWLSQHCAEQRQSEECLQYASRLLEIDSADQQACELALNAHLQLGQTARAIRLYSSFCQRLRRDLNAVPTAGMMRLYHRARMGLHD
ncbi:hypothetical protein IJT17_10020 [bacterium]|nr:hypothetical protein [bacterium]